MYFNITKKKIQPRNKYFPHPIGYAKINLRGSLRGTKSLQEIMLPFPLVRGRG
jgi:hypothetical protein